MKKEKASLNANGIIEPSIDVLLDRVKSKYALVSFASKRARQINDYFTDLQSGNVYSNLGPLVHTSQNDKPLTIALHEIAENKLVLSTSDDREEQSEPVVFDFAENDVFENEFAEDYSAFSLETDFFASPAEKEEESSGESEANDASSDEATDSSAGAAEAE